MTDDDVNDAWAAVHDATPKGWYVGQPSYHDERNEWVQYWFDPSEVPGSGKPRARNREWTAVGSTKLEVLVEMSRCLEDLKAGRTPK